MNTVVKYLAIGATLTTIIATALSGSRDPKHHNPSPEYEITPGRITSVQERQTTDREKMIYFDLEYVTGEKRSCSRVVLDNKYMYGDSGWIASPNHRDANDHLPEGQLVDVCCWGGGRMLGRCSFPGDSQYVGCMTEGKQQEEDYVPAMYK